MCSYTLWFISHISNKRTQSPVHDCAITFVTSIQVCVVTLDGLFHISEINVLKVQFTIVRLHLYQFNSGMYSSVQVCIVTLYGLFHISEINVLHVQLTFVRLHLYQFNSGMCSCITSLISHV